MTRIIRALACVLVFAAAAQAQESIPEASTPPAPAANVSRPRVLVMPFSTVQTNKDQDWVSKAVQESLVADLSQRGAGQPVAMGRPNQFSTGDPVLEAI